MSSDREAILGRVRSALAPLKERAALPDWDSELVVMRQARGDVDTWELFAQRLKSVNGTPIEHIRDLITLLDGNGWRRGYCAPDLWPRLQPAFPPSFEVETTFDRTRVDDYHFGITEATAAIAETGTLVLTDRDTSSRLAALAPWVHIAVIRRDRIFTDVPQAVAALPHDPNVIWCTGPSKTADVEGILIEGVHGPGRQIALLVG